MFRFDLRRDYNPELRCVPPLGGMILNISGSSHFPYPAFPPYFVRTQHIHGIRTTAVNQTLTTYTRQSVAWCMCVCRRLRGYVSACVHTSVTPRTGSPRRAVESRETPGSPGGVPGESPGSPGSFGSTQGIPGKYPGRPQETSKRLRGVPGESWESHREYTESPGSVPGRHRETPKRLWEPPGRPQGGSKDSPKVHQEGPKGSLKTPESPDAWYLQYLRRVPKGAPSVT